MIYVITGIFYTIAPPYLSHLFPQYPYLSGIHAAVSSFLFFLLSYKFKPAPAIGRGLHYFDFLRFSMLAACIADAIYGFTFSDHSRLGLASVYISEFCYTTFMGWLSSFVQF